MKLSQKQKKQIIFTQVWNESPEWNNDDAGALRGFLATTHGQRLSAQLRNASINLNAQACLSEDPAGEARKAAGYMIAISDIQSLSVPVAPQDDQSEEDVKKDEADIQLEKIASSNRKV